MQRGEATIAPRDAGNGISWPEFIMGLASRAKTGTGKGTNMSKDEGRVHPTPYLNQLESGPWPSFVTGLKRLRDHKDKQYAPMMNDLLGQLEQSYTNRIGYWKGGTVSVFGYGGGVIPRFSEAADKFPASKEFHTLRVQPPAGYHYTTDILREICAVCEQCGSGLIAFHGRSGDIMFQGCSTKNTQKAFDALNELGFDLGGAGPALRSSTSCVGHARCEMSCYDEIKAHRSVINKFLDEMHRPALPYKFKFKFSGCPNDCMNSIQRCDMATIGTWRDNIRTDEALARKWFARHGLNELVNDVVSRCPTKAITLKETKAVRKDAGISSVAVNDTQSLEIDNRDCVRCMHCINVMTGALAPGKDKGASVLVGGKSHLKIGGLMGTVVIPFMKLDTEEEVEKLVDFAQRTIDFFAENALEHERTGEMIERIGLANFLDAMEIDVDPAMINS